MFRLPSVCKFVNFNSCLLNHHLPKSLLVGTSVEHHSARYFAKGKDKKKENKGKAVKKKVEINEALLGEVINFEKLKIEMEHNLNKLHENYTKFVTLRTSLGSIETVRVYFEEKKYTLIELAQIVRKNPKVVVINMSTFPQALPAALKALTDSGMNLNPQQDGTTIFVPVPRLTREHRENLAKNAKVHFIKCRDGIRDVQNKCLKNLKSKDKDNISEDTRKEVEEQVKYIGDDYISRAETMLDAKQTELLGATELN